MASNCVGFLLFGFLARFWSRGVWEGFKGLENKSRRGRGIRNRLLVQLCYFN